MYIVKMELKNGYTILTKTGCKWCVKIKELLPDAHYIVCDIPPAAREAFFVEVDDLSGAQPRTFPMVFFDKTYIGGYEETRRRLECEYQFDSVYF